jgi:hypothetical protein
VHKSFKTYACSQEISVRWDIFHVRDTFLRQVILLSARTFKDDMLVAEIVHDGNEDTAYELGDEIMQMRVLHEGVDKRRIDSKSQEDDDEIYRCLES